MTICIKSIVCGAQERLPSTDASHRSHPISYPKMIPHYKIVSGAMQIIPLYPISWIRALQALYYEGTLYILLIIVGWKKKSVFINERNLNE